MALVLEAFHDREGWGRVLRCFPAYDFVHTFDFHAISHENGEGTPVLFAVSQGDGDYVAFWPALRREIPGTDFVDLSGVYGYGGPLLKNGAAADDCLNLIFQGMRDMRVVALFSRMHPLFVNDLPDSELRGVKLGDVVVINVNSDEPPLTTYRPAHRYEIRKAQKMGVQLIVDDCCSGMRDFVDIYQQSMRDIGASDYYLFSERYFDSFGKSRDYRVFIIFAELEGVKIAASMFVVTGKIMQYYLSGTVDEFKKIAPSKSIIARAHELAFEMGVDRIVLGGGVGSREDALFDFKRGFSRATLPFYVFKKIINQKIYSELCASRGLDRDAVAYFPAYRASL